MGSDCVLWAGPGGALSTPVDGPSLLWGRETSSSLERHKCGIPSPKVRQIFTLLRYSSRPADAGCLASSGLARPSRLAPATL